MDKENTDIHPIKTQSNATCIFADVHRRTRTCVHTCLEALRYATYMPMRCLRLVGSLKLQVSFAEYSLFYWALFQKRLIILRSILIVATPYTPACHQKVHLHACIHASIHTYIHVRMLPHMHACTHACMQACIVHIHALIHPSVHTHEHINVSTHTYNYTNMYLQPHKILKVLK